MSEALPPPDFDRIHRCAPRHSERRILPVGTRMVRVHPLGGPHPIAWDELRRWGPTDSRFDHQPEPAHVDSNRGIAYLAVNHRRANALTTAIGEVAQDSGAIVPVQLDHPDSRYVTVFDTIAELNLLDLTSGWVTRAGGNAAISSGNRFQARAWARSIYEHHPAIDGIFFPSSIYPPGRCVALWERGADCLPPTPLTSRSFVDLAPAIDDAARRLGTSTI